MADKYLNIPGLSQLVSWIKNQFTTKQDNLISGTNIKTINNNTILGSGNLPVVQGNYKNNNNQVNFVQGTEAINFKQTADGMKIIASSGQFDYIDRELVSKSYVSRYQTQDQVEALITDQLARFDKLDYEIVTALPATGATGVRYLIKHAIDDRYEEYIYVNGQWYDIGTTDEVNLTNYYTKQETTLLLDGKANTSSLPTSTSELTNDGDGTHNFVTFGNIATQSNYGVIKLNPNQSVTLNENGQLNVGGRLGQYSGTTGVFAPKTIQPALVDDGSFLLTEGSGTSLGKKSLAVTTGRVQNCRSAAAGSTVYRVQNTYVNRIACSIIAIEGAVVSLNENTAKQGLFANVLSVKINGSDYIPDSSANQSAQANDIIITLDKTVNPDAATTSIRFYPAEMGFSTVHAGMGIGSKNGNGASVLVGQGVVSNGGNACAMVGADLFNTGNGNGLFGRQHISRKNRWFMAGTGHDNTNGKTESGAVFGEFSLISNDTAFAIGNGTSQTARSNLFEIKTNGDIYVNGTKVLP